jgi:hypothetical protein
VLLWGQVWIAELRTVPQGCLAGGGCCGSSTVSLCLVKVPNCVQGGPVHVAAHNCAHVLLSCSELPSPVATFWDTSHGTCTCR